MHSSQSRKAMPVTGFAEARLPPCWVIAPCFLFIAHLTWSAAPKTTATGSIGRIWPPIIVQAPTAIGATETQRAHGSKQAPSAGWCWAAHYALLRAGAENGSWEGHDHGWWVDHSSWITTGCNTGLAPGIHNWLRAGHFAGSKAAEADHLSVGRHLLGMEINLKHTRLRQHKAESLDTNIMEIVLGRERKKRLEADQKETEDFSFVSAAMSIFSSSHALLLSSGTISCFFWLLIMDPIWYIKTPLAIKEIAYLNSSYRPILYHFSPLESDSLWHLTISFINNCRKEQKYRLALI